MQNHSIFVYYNYTCRFLFKGCLDDDIIENDNGEEAFPECVHPKRGSMYPGRHPWWVVLKTPDVLSHAPRCVVKLDLYIRQASVSARKRLSLLDPHENHIYTGRKLKYSSFYRAHK